MVRLERRSRRRVAGAESGIVSRATARLVSLDGVNGAALTAAARTLVKRNRLLRPAVSGWDASGIFAEISLADVGSGQPSARTLLLLYAADLAFRLRWEIGPALAAGRLVVAAPYVSTAIAFGRASGINAAWLTRVFDFAPNAATRHLVDAPAAHARSDRRGFVELACLQVLGEDASARRRLIAQTSLRLRTGRGR